MGALTPYRPPSALARIARAARELSARVFGGGVATRNKHLRGPSVGAWDPNPEFTPAQLYGTNGTAGILEKTRRTHPILSPAMDSRKEFMQSLNYRVVARANTPTHRACAQAVADLFDGCETHTLSAWVAATYDALHSYGHSVQTIGMGDTGVRITPVHPAMIYGFVADEETGAHLIGVQIQPNARFIDAGAVGVCSRTDWPGQWRGESILRPMLATQAIEEQLMAGVLRALAASTGTPVAKLPGVGAITPDEATEIDELLTAMVSGTSVVARVRDKVDVQWLSSPSQALSQFGPVMTLVDGRSRAAVGQALANLGVSRTGSNALGQVIQDASETDLRRHLEAALRTISGDTPATSTMMVRLAAWVGYPAQYAPRIEIEWERTTEATLEHIRTVSDMIAAGHVDPESGARWVARNLGVRPA